MNNDSISPSPGRRPSSPARTLARRAVAAIAACTALLAGLVMLASPASAHHPEISGVAECVPARGQATVNYTARTWSADPGPTQWQFYISESDIAGAPNNFQNPEGQWVQSKGHVILQYKANDSSVWNEVRNDIEFTPSNSGRVPGSFTIAETEFPITLRILDTGRWKSNAVASSNRTVAVSLPTDCSPDVSEPAASSSWVCDDETISVVLDNSASTVENTFDVTATDDTGVLSVSQTIAAGATDTSVSFPAPVEDGGPTVIAVKVGGTEIHTASYQASCDNPPPAVDCEDGETGVDTNDDEVDDTCTPVVCDEGEGSTDTGGNGVDDTCTPVVCDENETSSDAGGNGVDDTCTPVVCDENETSSDAGGNGVDDTCTEVIDDEETPPTTTPTTPTTMPTNPTPTTVVTPTTVKPTTVLPSSVGNPTALPRTGADTVVLAGIGFMVLLAGFGMTQTGRLVRVRISARRR